MCDDGEYATMILAGGLIVILGLYMKYVSEKKLIESELCALFCHRKKYGSRGEVVQQILKKIHNNF